MRLSSRATGPVDPDAVDFLDPALYADGEPHALWDHLRRHRPAHLQRGIDGREPFWVFTRYNDVCQVLHRHEEFSSRRGTTLCTVDLNLPPVAADQMFTDCDPPIHTRLREPLNRAMAMRSVRAREPRIRDCVTALLEPALDSQTFDLAVATRALPTAVAGTLMGLPEPLWPELERLATTAIAYHDPELTRGTPQATLRQANHELFAHLHEEISRRDRLDPGDDLIGILLSMRIDGEPLPDQQILFNCYSLLAGANVTTTHAAAGTVQALADHPDQFRLLEQDPHRVKTCVEEGLRWTSPVNHLLRVTRRDTRVGDQEIHSGELVSAWLGSANRDEDVFPDGGRFDILRTPNRHLAFGHDPHFCVGASLARLALRIFTTELLTRVARIETAGPARHLASTFIAGFSSLPVVLTPRSTPLALPDSALATARPSRVH
ncbi:cytochrome P450 [Streptomyces sp. NPDC005760]|uniref:cytochrome P450 n=1 Tax=Streptomyces sp. NPDC005760 TaxID=3156718 RepID=UPI0033CD7A87